MKRTTAPISLAGSQLGEVRHVCAFFNSDDEEYRVLLPFIKDGFECGDKAVHVVNPDQRHDHLQRLAAAGIDPTAAAAERAIRASDQHRNLPSGRPFRSGSDAGRCSSRWPAATPREDFRSVALSAAWTGRLKVDRTSTISLSSNRA